MPLLTACLTLAFQAPLAIPAQGPAPLRFDLQVAADSELELHAAWDPCRTSTYGLFATTPALRAPAPARVSQRYAGPLFRPFLPREPVALGEVWEVEGRAVFEFLRQFHAGAILQAPLGGEVPGTYACLRAVSERAFEVLIRAHACFELEGGIVYKPGQFEGVLVVERASGALLSFRLELPSRDTNVDVNVPTEYVLEDGTIEEGFSADIGWVPRMELASRDLPALAWSNEVPLEDARRKLRISFYAFASLDWLPFEEAVLRAHAEQKPLHLVLLFGALDDDSC
jgi:hypothetical protein